MDVMKPVGTLVTATLLAASVWMTAQKPLPAIPLNTDKPVAEAHKDHQTGAAEVKTSEREACSGSQLPEPTVRRPKTRVIGHV